MGEAEETLTEGFGSLDLCSRCIYRGLDLGHGSIHQGDLLVRLAHTQIAAVVPIRFAVGRSIVTWHSILIWGQPGVSKAAVVGLGDLFFAEDLTVYDLVDGEALHFVKILPDSVIVIACQQVFQRHKWFAPMGARLREIDRFGETVSAISRCMGSDWLLWQCFATCSV